MPKNPEPEGSPRLLTIDQIAAKHGVSRSSVHTYRRGGTFPRPVPVEGTTRVLFDADEVAAWFDANPKQQGRRTDVLAKKKQGESAVTQQTEAPTLSADARAILGIVWKWIADANDGLGSDVGDLQHDLETAGYGPLPKTEG